MNDGDDNIDDLLAELARKHKVALGADDPVAMLVTVNRFLLRETATSQEQLLQGFRESIATSSSEWNKLANKRAETILNATIQAAKNAVSAGAEAGVVAGLAPFLEQVNALSRASVIQVRQKQRLVTGFAYLVAVVMVCDLVWHAMMGLHR